MQNAGCRFITSDIFPLDDCLFSEDDFAPARHRSGSRIPERDDRACHSPADEDRSASGRSSSESYVKLAAVVPSNLNDNECKVRGKVLVSFGKTLIYRLLFLKCPRQLHDCFSEMQPFSSSSHCSRDGARKKDLKCGILSSCLVKTSIVEKRK